MKIFIFCAADYLALGKRDRTNFSNFLLVIINGNFCEFESQKLL